MTSPLEPSRRAWITTEDRVYLSRFPSGLEAPSSAILRLVQGVWELEGRHALRILRRPIQTDGPVQDFERDFVKVAAKSVREVPGPPPRGAPVIEIGGEDVPGVFRAEADREPVRAILRDAGGVELLRAESGAGRNRTLHAEVSLIQEWYRRTGLRLPVDARLEVSHKPCRMCAGLIVYWSDPARPTRVTYDIAVTGCRSRSTVLDRRGLLEWTGNGKGDQKLITPG